MPGTENASKAEKYRIYGELEKIFNKIDALTEWPSPMPKGANEIFRLFTDSDRKILSDIHSAHKKAGDSPAEDYEKFFSENDGRKEALNGVEKVISGLEKKEEKAPAGADADVLPASEVIANGTGLLESASAVLSETDLETLRNIYSRHIYDGDSPAKDIENFFNANDDRRAAFEEIRKSAAPYDPKYEEKKKAALDQVKGFLVNAGYGDELQKYKGDSWFRAVCDCGLIRNGRGDAIRPEKYKDPGEAALSLTSVNGAFYIPDRDDGSFRKYGSNGMGGYVGQQYNTPSQADRPNMFVRLLDYLGFNMPSVKAYKQQMKAYSNNPLYLKLHREKAQELSERFKNRSIRRPYVEPEDEKKAPEKAAEAVQPKPADIAEKAPETAPETLTAPESEFKAGGTQPEENKAETAVKEDPDALSDIDIKLFELTEKEKSYPESSPMGRAILETKEALNEVKKLGALETADDKLSPEQYAALKKSARGLLSVSEMEFIIETQPGEQADRFRFGRENSAEVKKELEDLTPDTAIDAVLAKNTAGKMNKILADPAGIMRFEKALGKEIERQEKTKEDPDALSDIDIKLFELTEKEKSYPESSPMGRAILETKEALNEVKKLGALETADDKLSPEQYAALKKSARGLLSVSEMEFIIETQPGEQADRFRFGRENSAEVKKELEDLTPDTAIDAVLDKNATGRMKKILADPAGILRFEKEIGIETEKLAVKAEQKAAEAEPEKKEEQPEKDGKKEIIPASEKKEEQPAEQKNTDADTGLIDRKLAELERKEKYYPESSPMGLAILSAKEGLEALKRNGMPTAEDVNADSPRYNAVLKASSGLLLIDRMDKILETATPEERSRLTLGRENSGKIRDDIRKLTSADAVERAMHTNAADKMRRILGSPAELEKFRKQTVREMKKNPKGNLIDRGAVIHGSVYKVPGNPVWRRMPGATEEDVLKSINEIKSLKPGSVLFSKLEKAEKYISETQKKADILELKQKENELRKQVEAYPKGSVMRQVGQGAVNALAKLGRTGLPQDRNSPLYASQTAALKDAAATVCSFRRFSVKAAELGLDSPDVQAKGSAEKILDAFKDNPLIDSMAKGSPERLNNILLKGKADGTDMLKELRGEEKYRKENGIPDKAERKGALYRMGPNEQWKQVPGASMKDVNDSLLTVIDEEWQTAMRSEQKSAENVHFSDASLANGI